MQKASMERPNSTHFNKIAMRNRYPGNGENDLLTIQSFKLTPECYGNIGSRH